MKTVKKLASTVMLLLFISTSFGQSIIEQQVNRYSPAWQFSLRAGIDLPDFENNTPYVDYKPGLTLGTSVDYYFSWIGLGVDFDYIQNNAENFYPTENLWDAAANPITSFGLQEDKVSRTFIGLGPSGRYVNNNQAFSIEGKARVGISSIKGGETRLDDLGTPQVLNYHAGYDLKSVFSAKGSIQFNYFFNNAFGVHLGAYYLKHFNTKEDYNSALGASMGYQNLITQETILALDGTTTFRDEPCDCDLQSIGVFAGVTLKLNPKAKITDACFTCDTYSLAVTARDKFTKELLANTDVVVKKLNGDIVQSGTTNSFGVVVFNDIEADNYSIEGLLYNVALENSSTQTHEFKVNETLQKEILYGDENFILQGKAVVCNSTTPINNVSVVLKNTSKGIQKSTLTDNKGVFIFHMDQKEEYTIYGKKQNYFSQTETIKATDFNRNTTLFVKLEICMEEAVCGKAIALKNIHYDLDKFFIRADAQPELNRLVQFMIDNPSIKVEVSSHTDSRGSHAYNETLSQNRANAAVDYLVSQGISRSRLSGVGYGETRLLNECADNVDCPEWKHQLNRRTEMKVICD